MGGGAGNFSGAVLIRARCGPRFPSFPPFPDLNSTNSRKNSRNDCTNSLKNDTFYVVNPTTGSEVANRR